LAKALIAKVKPMNTDVMSPPYICFLVLMRSPYDR
jgi:hypothetical protein